jgi:hypothetical protein
MEDFFLSRRSRKVKKLAHTEIEGSIEKGAIELPGCLFNLQFFRAPLGH